MLVSDKYRFIIACPTKTGTNSLRAVVEKWKRSGGDVRVLNLLSGEDSTRHRIAPPPGKESYTRYMMVRNPVERLVSMYEYLRRKEWEWSAKEILRVEADKGREAAWVHMLEIIMLYRDSDGYFDAGRRKHHGIRPYMWTDRLSEMEDYLTGIDLNGSELPWYHADVRAFELEDVGAAWDQLLADHDVEEDALWDVVFPHRNSSPADGRLFGDAAAYLEVDGASDLVDEVVGRDMRWYGYA